MSSLRFGRTIGDCAGCNGKGIDVVFAMIERGGTFEESEHRCLGCLLTRPLVLFTQEIEQDEEKKKVVISKKRRKRVAAQEREMAEMVGGRTQAGSGSVAGCKGDVRKKGKFRIECKSTEAKSFSVKREILDKIRSECGRQELPALDILFLDHNTMREEDRWVAIPFSQFEEFAAWRS